MCGRCSALHLDPLAEGNRALNERHASPPTAALRPAVSRPSSRTMSGGHPFGSSALTVFCVLSNQLAEIRSTLCGSLEGKGKPMTTSQTQDAAGRVSAVTGARRRIGTAAGRAVAPESVSAASHRTDPGSPEHAWMVVTRPGRVCAAQRDASSSGPCRSSLAIRGSSVMPELRSRSPARSTRWPSWTVPRGASVSLRVADLQGGAV